MREVFPLGGLGLPDLGILCFVLAVAVVPAIFYFLTLQKALSRVHRSNRLMEPGLVWLGFIPLFHLVWSFVIATRVPDSLRNEFQDQRRDAGGDYGKGVGLANAILGAVSFPLLWISGFSMIVAPVGFVRLALFIIFWTKIADYSARLALPARSHDERDFDSGDDYSDERGSYPDRGPHGPSSDCIRPDDRGRYK